MNGVGLLEGRSPLRPQCFGRDDRICGGCACLDLPNVVSSYVTSYRRLSHIKGPPVAAWTDLWWINAALSRKGHLYLYDACRKYGMTNGDSVAQGS